MKVYVVTQGQYSDFHIERMFSTLEKAEAFVGNGANLDEYDRYNIEEYDVDIPTEDRVLPHWTVRLVLESGRILDAPLSRPPYYGIRNPNAGCKVQLCEKSQYIQEAYICVTSTTSTEHAMKVAVEKRQEWLRTRLQ